MIVGGYSVDCYCDNQESPDIKHYFYHSDGNSSLVVEGELVPFSFSGRNESKCLKYIRWAGWSIGYDKLVLCPVCRKKGVTLRKLRLEAAAAEGATV